MLSGDALAELLLPASNIPPPLALTDSWLLHSVMHKAIRRGEGELAARAGMALLELDPNQLWRRLITIAFEDVGIGDPKAMIHATIACRAAWRKSVGGHARVVNSLARILADAPKDRSSDNLITAAHKHPGLEEWRNCLAAMPIGERLSLASDPSLPLPARATACWYASGIDWFRVRRVGPGDLSALLAGFLDRGADPDLVTATRAALKRVREPIVLMPALLATLSIGDSYITEGKMKSTADAAGIPLCAFDRFTRLGKEAIRRFAYENATFKQLAADLLPSRSWPSLAGFLVFHVEGGLLARRCIWPGSEELERLGVEADLLPMGIPPKSIPALLRVVAAELGQLDEIRTTLLRDS